MGLRNINWVLQEVGGDCQTDIDCLGMLCVATDPGALGVCSSECATDADCPAPLLCTDFDTVRVCLPPPASDGGCGCSAVGEREPVPLAILGLALVTFFGLARRRELGQS